MLFTEIHELLNKNLAWKLEDVSPRPSSTWLYSAKYWMGGYDGYGILYIHIDDCSHKCLSHDIFFPNGYDHYLFS